MARSEIATRPAFSGVKQQSNQPDFGFRIALASSSGSRLVDGFSSSESWMDFIGILIRRDSLLPYFRQ